ncbi:quaternary ammonium compound-resistance protein SugE [Paenibacillus algorifonticola]|uniref:Quaternary ammonium compound-resistance protein SugE n=1 Tax=Paenibacillus algorifonticola TaxID=684063 RepID=A0A1I2GCQ2_9BACL|nr:multidrug efflux SMR transporter [Paenibacillus algorifonticola]SFF14963.1 quaternary ammonium compound-resistance protein SugE [Paenibacillus algorifonticola]
MKAWLYVILGGIFEVFWTFGLKYSKGFTDPLISVITVILIIISFVLFARSMQLLEIGTAYAVFTGIGTAGTVVFGILVLGESADIKRLLLVSTLIIGIIGLKLVSSDKPKQEQAADAEVTQSAQAAQTAPVVQGRGGK